MQNRLVFSYVLARCLKYNPTNAKRTLVLVLELQRRGLDDLNIDFTSYPENDKVSAASMMTKPKLLTKQHY